LKIECPRQIFAIYHNCERGGANIAISEKTKDFDISFKTQFKNQFCLRMGTEPVPETLYSNELTRLCAREDYIKDFDLVEYDTISVS
jgi:hypothetical protein